MDAQPTGVAAGDLDILSAVCDDCDAARTWGWDLLTRCGLGGAELARLERVSKRFWRRNFSVAFPAEGDGLLPGRGAALRVEGLASAAGKSLNGRAATMLAADKDSGRIMVAVEGVERKKRLQRVNLRVPASLAEAAAEAAVLGRPDGWRVHRRGSRRPLDVVHPEGVDALAAHPLGCTSGQLVQAERAQHKDSRTHSSPAETAERRAQYSR